MCGSSCTRKLVVLYGPTGVGKTDASLSIAQHAPVEIINMDVGQLYTPFTIGVAKPDWQNEPIPHHLFDEIDVPESYTVVKYRQKVLARAEKLWQKGKLPLLVGGSGFYLKSFLFPPCIPETKVSHNADTLDISWDKLNSIDPERAQSIKKNDTYRIERALRMWQTTQKKPSQQMPVYNPPCCVSIIYLTRDRQELYDRINTRTHIMLKEGWIDEVRQLFDTEWISFIKKKKLIGYNEIVDYLQGAQTLEDTTAIIQKKTRNYAKRQGTFWRMLKRLIDAQKTKNNTPFHVEAHAINLTLHDVPLYIKQFFNASLQS